jgi:hypothetical protein
MFLPANDAGEVSHAVIKLRMITMMKHVASLAFMLAAGPAFGQSLPSFSIEKHCQSYGGDSDYCVQRTQEIYGRLQERWESILAEVRSRCLKWLKTASKPDSYYQLEGCVLGSAMPPPTSAYGYAPPLRWGYYYGY